MIIEFVGLMGAGKTTLHHKTVQSLTSRGCTVWTPRMLGQLCGNACFWMPPPLRHDLARLTRFWFRVKAAGRSRTLVWLAIRHLMTSGRPLRDKLRGLRWFLTSLGNHWRARRRLPSDQIILIDEGLAQRVFSVFIHGCSEINLEGVRRYARTLPRPDVLVYLKVSAAVATSRTAARTKALPQRFQSLTGVQLNQLFARASVALDIFVEEMRTVDSGPRILVIEGDDSHLATLEFDRQLEALLSSWPAPTELPQTTRSRTAGRALANSDSMVRRHH